MVKITCISCTNDAVVGKARCQKCLESAQRASARQREKKKELINQQKRQIETDFDRELPSQMEK